MEQLCSVKDLPELVAASMRRARKAAQPEAQLTLPAHGRIAAASRKGVAANET